MQLTATLTFSFSEADEAEAFFSSLAESFNRAKTAMANSVRSALPKREPAAAPTEDPQPSTAKESPAVKEPAAKSTRKPRSDKSEAAKIAEAVASGGREKLPGAGETQIEITLEMLTDLARTAAAQGGSAHKIGKIVKEYGVARVSELPKEKYSEVHRKLKDLVKADDEIPF